MDDRIRFAFIFIFSSFFMLHGALALFTEGLPGLYQNWGMGGKNEPTDCTPLWIVFWRDDWKLCFVGTLHWLSSTFKISSNLNVGYFLAFPCFLSNAAQSGSLVSRRAGVRFARWVDSVGDAQHTDPSHPALFLYPLPHIELGSVDSGLLLSVRSGKLNVCVKVTPGHQYLVTQTPST